MELEYRFAAADDIENLVQIRMGIRLQYLRPMGPK